MSNNAEFEYLLSLLRSLLKNKTAAALPEGCTFERIFDIAKRHSVAGMAYYAAEALEQPPCGNTAAEWRQVRDKGIVKDITQQTELEKISSAFSQAGVRFLLLKGSIIKKLYPQSDMRTMSDIDMLIDEDNAVQARQVMTGLGYSCEHFGYDVHDIYYKPPMMNVEIHRALFGEEGQEFQSVFGNPWDLCVNSGESLSFRFEDNAFFAYILAHAIKHLEEGGTGIRTIMDLWVCLNSDMKINREEALRLLEPSGKQEAAKRLIELSEVWFDEKEHTTETRRLEQYILGSGTYGTVSNSAANKIAKSGRVGYLIRLIFPTFTHMKQHYPVLKKAPALLPVCWLVRLVTKPFINRRQNADKLRMLIKK